MFEAQNRVPNSRGQVDFELLQIRTMSQHGCETVQHGGSNPTDDTVQHLEVPEQRFPGSLRKQELEKPLVHPQPLRDVRQAPDQPGPLVGAGAGAEVGIAKVSIEQAASIFQVEVVHVPGVAETG